MINAFNPATYDAGLQAREQQQMRERRNALADIAQTQGMDSPQFLNALAGVDPAQAYGLRQGDRRMDMQGEQFDRRMAFDERQFAAQQEIQRQRLALSRAAAGRANRALQGKEREQGLKSLAAMIGTNLELPDEAQRLNYAQIYDLANELGYDLKNIPTPDRYTPEIGKSLFSALSQSVYRGPQPVERWDDLTPQEVEQLGLEPGRVWQRSSTTNQVRSAGGSGNTTLNVNTGPNQTKFQERSGTLLADEVAEVAQSGAEAQSNLRAVDRLEALLENTPTGGGAAIRQFLGNFGISTTGLSDIQAAQALINRLVPDQRPPGSGPMSDADLELFKQSLPRIINTPDGNKQIIETLKGIAQYDVARGRIARDLQLGKIDISEADKRWNSLTNPLGGVWSDGESTTQAVTPEMVRSMSREDVANIDINSASPEVVDAIIEVLSQ